MTISTAAPDSELRAVGWVGRTMPLACTAAGRALLFDLDAAQIARLIASEGLAQGAPAAPRSLDELVAGALILYPRYRDPATGLPCPPEVLLERLAVGAAPRRPRLPRALAARGGAASRFLAGWWAAR